jgi:hypothetical protein
VVKVRTIMRIQITNSSNQKMLQSPDIDNDDERELVLGLHSSKD